MKRIYLQAEQVIPYIGPATQLTLDAVDLALILLLFCSDRNRRKSARLDDDADVDEIIRTLHLPARTDGTWQPLRDLFSRPWPTRIWIVQESMLNNKHIMACGRIVFPDWELLPQLAVRLLSGTFNPALTAFATGVVHRLSTTSFSLASSWKQQTHEIRFTR